MFDWREFFNTAEYMYRNVDDFPSHEACYRIVVSRAYYAAFCLSRNFVIEKYPTTNFYSNEHQEVQKFFQRKTHDNNMVKIGNQLSRLHQDRKKADYDNVLNEAALMKAGKSLRVAKEIINKIEQLFSAT